MWKENVDNNQIKMTQDDNALSTLKEIKVAKNAMKKSVQAETLHTWNECIKKLTFQDNFVQLLIEEKETVSWKSVCINIPKGVLSFALKSFTRPDNLKRWGIRKMDTCVLCKNHGTLECTLNYCNVAFNQGRLTWEHGSVLMHFT